MSTHTISRNKTDLGLGYRGRDRNAEGVRFSDRWRTPRWLFDKLDGVFNFDFDMCASDDNHLCNNYFTASDDATTAELPTNARSIFCNPPFSGKTKQKLLDRAPEIVQSGRRIVFVLPADLSNVFFYDLIHNSADRVLVINGRIGYGDPNTGDVTRTCDGVGTMIVVFDGSVTNTAVYRAWGLFKSEINFILRRDLIDIEIAELKERLAPYD